ncbi:Sugar/inositol transporter [Macleaya cordata]|uniref:Sugar/inositol transporter n=1 Tax=Macleaya cordata TaxID=56857 RepID=A0A200PXR7_MACCD|nr:Sugar/inositol transporter [Macleaya cordata]
MARPGSRTSATTNSDARIQQYPGKTTRHVFFSSVVAICSALIFGYEIGISGGVTIMGPFLEKFFPKGYRQELGTDSVNQYCKFNGVTDLTLFTSSFYLAALLASLFASSVTGGFSRKLSIFFSGVVLLVGAVISGAAKNVMMLILGRILLGIGVGFVNQVVPPYQSEIAPYKNPVILNIKFQWMITVGIGIANVVNYGTNKINCGWGWRVSLGLAALPALFITISSLFLPDTPKSIIERNNLEKAKEQLQRIRGVVNVNDEFDDLVADSEKVKQPWKNIMMDMKYRPHLFMAILIPFFQHSTGINVLLFYAPVLFKSLGFGNDASLAYVMIMGLVYAFFMFVAILFLKSEDGRKRSRRNNFSNGSILLFIIQVAVGGFLIMYKLKFETHSTNRNGLAVALEMCIYVGIFAMSWGLTGWEVLSEVFPVEIRSAAQNITVSVNMLFNFIIAHLFLNMLCHMKFGVFFFFAGFVAFGSIFLYHFVPETKGKSIEEMGRRVWKQHWYWGKYIPDDEELIMSGNIQWGTAPRC